MENKETELSFDGYAHFISGTIDPMTIEQASRWLMYAKFNKFEKPLTLYVNSEGGDLGDAIGLVDMMRGIKSEIGRAHV